jgi:hypothetical protein
VQPHHLVAAAPAKQRQGDLRHQAEQARLACGRRTVHRLGAPPTGGCRRSARRTCARPRRGGTTERVVFLVDPASGWTWWTPPSPVEGEPQADQAHEGLSRRPAGRGLVPRLLGRVGAWLGIGERTPSGA